MSNCIHVCIPGDSVFPLLINKSKDFLKYIRQNSRNTGTHAGVTCIPAEILLSGCSIFQIFYCDVLLFFKQMIDQSISFFYKDTCLLTGFLIITVFSLNQLCTVIDHIRHRV